MSFVPTEFAVPNHVERDQWELRLLTVDDLARDYAAYMGSIDHVKSMFNPNAAAWPQRNLSMRLALTDLAFCEWEHYCRTSFSYGVFTKDNRSERGCVYINPTAHLGSQAELLTWTTADEYERGFDAELFAFAKAWVQEAWPFERVAYPGREHSWDDCSRAPFLPKDFEVPNDVTFGDHSLRLLTMEDLLLDYTAYMSCINHLRGVLGPGSVEWPTPSLTLDLALADLGWCEWMHHNRSCFSYGVFTADHGEEIGCLYVSPSGKKDYDARIVFWLTEEKSRQGMEERLSAFAHDFVASSWPFQRPAFPGREIDWTRWQTLPDA